MTGPFPSMDPDDVRVSTYLSELVYRAADASRAGGDLDSQSFSAAEAALQSLFPSLQLDVSVHTAGAQRYLVGESQSAVYVAFQGTHHPNDWLSNLRYTHTPFWQATNVSAAAHKGFVARSQSVPMEHLHARAQSANKRLVLCGHSLGGAVATLGLLRLLGHSTSRPAAARVAACAPAAGLRGVVVGSRAGSGAAQDPRVRCICFATPAFANEALARHVAEAGLDKYICNFVIPEDPVVPFIHQLMKAGASFAGTQLPPRHPGSTPRPDSPLAMGATALSTDDASDSADDDSGSDTASTTSSRASSSASTSVFASITAASQQHGQRQSQRRRRRHSSALLRPSDSASSLSLWDALPSIKKQRDHAADAAHSSSTMLENGEQWGAAASSALAVRGGSSTRSGRQRRASTGSKTMLVLPLASVLLPPLRHTAVGLVHHRDGMLHGARLLLGQIAAGLRAMALATRMSGPFRVLPPLMGRWPLGISAGPTAVTMLHLIGASMAASMPQNYYIGQQYVMTAAGAEPVLGPLSKYPKNPDGLRLHELKGAFPAHRMIAYRNRVLQVLSSGQGLVVQGPQLAL